MPNRRPNLLFLLSDEHSFRFMGHRDAAAGGEPVRTPTLDRLAAGGTVFTDAYCQMPLCTPSRLCILTGQEVREAGAWTNESVLRPELPTIPETLRKAGYETCLVGKMHLGGSRQFVGFRHRPYGDLTGKCGHQWEPITDEARQEMSVRTSHVGITGIPESQIQDQIVCHETVAWLREHTAKEPDRPWFLCASFSRPHFPLTAPRRWIDSYLGRVPEPPVPAGGDAYDHPMSAGMRKGFKSDRISYTEMMKARAAYFACVSYLDEVLGDLMARLDRDGLLDNTIIVYTTDHGEMAGEHGVWWKNGWYEACTRVPLIVSLPEQRTGGKPAREVSTPVALTDLFPTFCDLLGADSPTGLAGRSLAAAVQDGAPLADRPVFTDSLTPRWGAGTEFRSIRWKTWKYVVFRDAPPLFFDLATDPGEQTNLVAADLSGDALAARSYLAQVAEETTDFAAAAWERTERDAGLRQEYAQNLPPSTGNLYLMPDGRLLNADDLLYHPTVIAERPEDAFTG
jgi:choline-sulfatase